MPTLQDDLDAIRKILVKYNVDYWDAEVLSFQLYRFLRDRIDQELDAVEEDK